MSCPVSSIDVNEGKYHCNADSGPSNRSRRSISFSSIWIGFRVAITGQPRSELIGQGRAATHSPVSVENSDKF